jgi:1-phosphofructokinase family hexose kinase
MKNLSIITVGICPAWDILCYGQELAWGLHKEIETTSFQPAGKAMNLSRALAWMCQRNTAAGLWGQDDYEQMLKAMKPLNKLIKAKITPVKGSTRQNITIVDTKKDREMHLRNKSELASKTALRKLKADLKEIIKPGSVCVFAGAIPDDNFAITEVLRIIELCKKRKVKIAVDTYGQALKSALETGCIWLIKPNVEELRELLGKQIKGDPSSLVKAGQQLLAQVDIVFISRGKQGAIVVTKNGAWHGRCSDNKKVLSTVGCGDFLLGGFLKGLKEKSDTSLALETAIKAATARAWGWTDKMSWPDAQDKIKVQVEQI